MRIFRAIQGWEEQSPGNSFFFAFSLHFFGASIKDIPDQGKEREEETSPVKR